MIINQGEQGKQGTPRACHGCTFSGAPFPRAASALSSAAAVLLRSASEFHDTLVGFFTTFDTTSDGAVSGATGGSGPTSVTQPGQQQLREPKWRQREAFASVVRASLQAQRNLVAAQLQRQAVHRVLLAEAGQGAHHRADEAGALAQPPRGRSLPHVAVLPDDRHHHGGVHNSSRLRRRGVVGRHGVRKGGGAPNLHSKDEAQHNTRLLACSKRPDEF